MEISRMHYFRFEFNVRTPIYFNVKSTNSRCTWFRMFILCLCEKCVWAFFPLATVVVDVVCFTVKMTVLNILLVCHFEPLQCKLTEVSVFTSVQLERNGSFQASRAEWRWNFWNAQHMLCHLSGVLMMNIVWNMILLMKCVQNWISGFILQNWHR